METPIQQPKTSLSRAFAEARGLSPEALAALIDTVPAMVWIGDEEGRIRYFNEQFYTYTGLKREDDDGYLYLQIIHPDDMPKRAAALELIKQRKPIEVEVRHKSADGHYKWYLVRGIPLHMPDGSVSYIGTNTDIDDRKNAEEALQKSESEFRTLAELIPQLVIVADADGRVFYCNKRFYDFIGIPREEEDGFLWKKVVHKDDLVQIEPQLGTPPDPGGVWEMELRYRDASGIYRWHLVRAVALANSNKIFATATYIDEQKRETDELRRSEIHLRTLAEAIPQIVWTTDANGVITFVNQRYYEFTGLSAEQSAAGAWQLLVHPDDLKTYLDGWQESLATGDTFECTFGLKRVVGLSATDGYRRHLCRAIAFRGSSGNIIQWFGTWTDVEGS